MSVVLMPGMRPRGREPNVFDINPGFDVPSTAMTNRRFMRAEDGIIAPPLLNDAIQRPHTMKVLGCGIEPMTNRMLRKPATDPMMGVVPPTGYARGQKRGLAYEYQKPLKGKILKQADTFDASRDTGLQ